MRLKALWQRSWHEYYDRDRAAFYAAIQGVRDGGMDLTGWLEYFVDGLATQLAEVRHRDERVIQRNILAKEHGLCPQRPEPTIGRCETASDTEGSCTAMIRAARRAAEHAKQHHHLPVSGVD
jgi:hypothetical protein